MDKKDWMQDRADEIAREQYGVEFYDLSDDTQEEVYNQAGIDYADHVAMQVEYQRG